MYVSSSVKEEPNYMKTFTTLPALDQWTKIKLSQQKKNYSIIMDGIELHSEMNYRPREFYGVKVYASNPWHTAQPGSIRGLIIETVDQS